MKRLLVAVIFLVGWPLLAAAQSNFYQGKSGGLVCTGCTSGKIVGYNGTNLVPTPLTFSGGAITLGATANTTPLTISGGSTTGSGTHTLGLTVTGTLNTTGAVDGAALFANVTNTASGAGSPLVDLKVGGVTQLFIPIVSTVGSYILDGISGLETGVGTGNIGLYKSGQVPNGPHPLISMYDISGTPILGMGSGTAPPDINLTRAAAGILDQRLGTNAQSFRVNGGWTAAADQAYGFIDAGQAAANTLEIGSTHAGTAPNGNLTNMALIADGVEVMRLINTSGSGFVKFSNSASFDSTATDCGAALGNAGCLVIIDNNGNTLKLPVYGTL